MEIQAPVEAIGSIAFLGCASQRELVFASGTRIQTIGQSNGLQAFLVYVDDGHMKQRRREIRWGTLD
jgi:hypothetical protein